MEPKPCVNCNAEIIGNFCSNCGQRTAVKRLSFREGWNDFWARIYGFDGLFPRTLRDLTMRPGFVSRSFLDGNRVKYYGPVGYFFFIITLMYLVASLLGVDILEFYKDIGRTVNSITNQTPKAGSGQEQFMELIMRKVSDNLKILSFLVVPVQALVSRYMFFRKSGLTYIEHMVLPLYTQGHVYWITILSIIIFSFFGVFFPSTLQVLLTIFFTSFSYISLFSYQSKIKVFLKGFGIYLVTQVLYSFLIIVVMGIGTVIALMSNPELLQMIKPSNNP